MTYVPIRPLTKRFVVVACLALGLVMLHSRTRIDPPAQAAANSPNPTAPERMAIRLARDSTLSPVSNSRADRRVVVDPADWQNKGPKEPIVPPVVHVDAEIDARGVAVSESLIPPVLHLDVESVSRGTGAPTSEPLTPPVISEDALTPSLR